MFYRLGGVVVLSTIPSVLLAFDTKTESFSITEVKMLSEGFQEQPAMASDAQGNAWMVSLDFQKGGKQNISIYRFCKIWQKINNVTKTAGSYETPEIAIGRNSQPLIVWSSEKGDKWTIESAVFSGKKFVYSCAVDGPYRAANPAIVSGNHQDNWLVWEGYHDGKFDIYLKRFKSGKWLEPIKVSSGSENSYDPALAVSPDGKVFVAYSQADGPNRTIKLVSYNPDSREIGETIRVAVGGLMKDMPNMNTHPALGFDSQRRLWITWETRAISLNERISKTPCYFGTRCCPVVCFFDGKIQKIANADPYVFKGANDHKPIFVKTADGQLGIFTRNSEAIRKWHVRTSFLGVNGWSDPVTLIDRLPRGREDMLAVAPGAGSSLFIGWQADTFKLEKLWFEVTIDQVKSQLFTAKLTLPTKDNSILNLLTEPVEMKGNNEKDFARPWQARQEVDINGQKYTLLWGNLHDHTNYSRCWSDGSNGDLDEKYRYGLDVEGYDFIALTDHGYDLNESRWSRSRRAARFYNDPQRLVALPAFEWTFSAPDRPLGSGHRNLIFESDKDAAKWVNEKGLVYSFQVSETNRIDKVWDLLNQKNCNAITIPHHPADKDHPVCWQQINQDYQMVVEIFQDRRSAEYRNCPDHTYNPTKLDGSYVQDALAIGHKLGFVSGGDHNAMGVGVTALFVKEVSQAGIIEALRSRRCYGTSGDKIVIDFRIKDAFMGQELTVKEKPTIKAHIIGTAPLTSVVVFKNNNIVWEKNTDQLKGMSDFEFQFTDEKFESNCYYYVRAIQSDGQIVWASPIWCFV